MNGKMELNDVGGMVKELWLKLQEKFHIERDVFEIMPNHVHGIVSIVGANPCVRPGLDSGTMVNDPRSGQTRGSAPTIGTIVQWFKTMTTNAYINGVRKSGWKPFPGKFWQRNYYERVIQNEKELLETREYIQQNPLKWDTDPEHPDHI